MKLQIITALIGCIPGLLVPIISWIQRRTRLKKELWRFDHNLKRLEAIKKLLNAFDNFQDSKNTQQLKNKLLEELTIIGDEIITQGNLFTSSSHNGDISRPFIQRLLLLYKPASFKGWMLHVPFYMISGAMIFLWSVVMITNTTNKYTVPYFAYIIATVIALCVLILLQKFASRLNRK